MIVLVRTFHVLYYDLQQRVGSRGHH